MKVVKLLEKKEVIRVFGVGLWVAPLINSFLTYLALPASAGSTGFRAYWQIVISGTTTQHILDIASLVIGVLLLTGAKSAWKAMLALLGGYMILQVMNLGSTLRNNPLNGLFFIANVGLFLFIADQLAFKQKVAPQSKTFNSPSVQELTSPSVQALASPSVQDPDPTPVSGPTSASAVASVVPFRKTNAVPAVAAPRPFRKSSARILVNFQNHGPWAQVISISAAGIELRSDGRTPPDIESREVELNLSPNLLLRARLKSRNGSLYFFEYTDLSQSRIQQLNRWLLDKAA